jgi:HEAT repeat protein
LIFLLVIAVMAVLFRGVAAAQPIGTPAKPQPTQIQDRYHSELMDFFDVQATVEAFKKNHGHYAGSLAEAYACAGAPSGDTAPDLKLWDYAPNASRDSYVLRHRKIPELYRVDPANPEERAKAFASPDHFLRLQAFTGITSSTADLEFLEKTLRSNEDPVMRSEAVSQISLKAPAPRARALYFEALLDPEEDVWSYASRHLMMSRTENQDALAKELEAMGASPDRKQRLQAARGFYAVGSEKGAGLAILNRLIDDADPEIRLSAATSIGDNFRRDNPWPEDLRAKVLAGMNQTNDPSYRRACTLAAAEHCIPEAVPVLTDFLRAAQSKEEIGDLVRPLYSLKSPRGEEIPVLRSLRNHPDQWVREIVANALASRDYPEREKDWMSLLKDPAPEVRKEWVGMAGRMTKEPGLLIPKLIARLDDKSPDVRLEAVQALGAYSLCPCPWHLEPNKPFGALKDSRAVRPLVRALKDPDHRVRVMAAAALCFYRSPESAPALMESLTDSSHWQHYNTPSAYAAYALQEMKEIVPPEKMRDAFLAARPCSVEALYFLRTSDLPEKEKIGRLVHTSVAAQLESSDERQVLGALCALQVFPSAVFTERIAALRRHPCAVVRREAENTLKRTEQTAR